MNDRIDSDDCSRAGRQAGDAFVPVEFAQCMRICPRRCLLVTASAAKQSRPARLPLDCFAFGSQ
jgi:hypothetical protein